MVIALWIVDIVLALAFLAAGALKTVRSKPALRKIGLGWVDDFPPAAVKLIGIAEVLGALGLVLPLATGIAPVLSPIAASALVVLMVGAVTVHVRRREQFAPALVLAVVAAVSAVLGYIVVLG